MVINNMTTHEFLLYYIDVAYSRLNHIEQVDERMSQIVDKKQFNEIKHLMFDDICGSTNYFKTLDECHNFANGATKEGITVLISEFLSNARLVIEAYEYEKDQKPTIQLLDTKELYESCIFFRKKVLNRLILSNADSAIDCKTY